MGLLVKAEEKRNPDTLDTPVRSLRERILQLSGAVNAPFMALSLLRAHGVFQYGVCLSLVQPTQPAQLAQPHQGAGVYHGYASAGFGIEKLVLPAPVLVEGWGTDLGSSYYQTDLSRLFAAKTFPPGTEAWVFPLEDVPHTSLCPAIMLLIDETPGRMNPRMVARLVTDIRDVLVPHRARPPQEPAPPVLPPLAMPPIKKFPLGDSLFETLLSAPGGHTNRREPASVPGVPGPAAPRPADSAQVQRIQESLSAYSRTMPVFQGLVLAVPPRDGAGPVAHCQAAAAFSQVIPLAESRILLLFRQGLDRELIAHRLGKDLGAHVLASFEAADPDQAFSQIAAYVGSDTP